MSLSADLKAINCSACGAGLDLLGGGRVMSYICPYCGTELDALDDYQALRKFNDIPRPETPFPIGTKGILKGVEFTVIGILLCEERWEGQIWRWLDHQLYSPTHGYAWLTFEDGHLIFSRRYRSAVWMSETQVDQASTRPSVHAEGQVFKYYETSRSQITFAEGEFTWRPRKGQYGTTVSALGKDAMLSFSETGQEREIEISTYVTQKEIAEGFGLDTPFRVDRVHPLQPLAVGPNRMFVIKTSLSSAVLCGILALILSGWSGTPAFEKRLIPISELPVEIPIEVPGADDLVRVKFAGNGKNTWTTLEVEMTTPEDEPLFIGDRTVEYYSGRDSDGRWTEGSNRASLGFFAPLAGTYTMSLDIDEVGEWSSDTAHASQISVAAFTGGGSGYWLAVLGVVFVLIGAWPLWQAYRDRSRKWSGSDWDDDD